MKNKILILILVITTFTYGNGSGDIKQSWLNKQPKSYAKDFYIWRYLKQNITPKQARDALGQIKRLNNKLFYRYVTKSDNYVLKDYKSCMRAKTKNLLDKKPYCIEAGLSLYDATKLKKSDLKNIIKKLDIQYPRLKAKLEVLNSPIPFASLETATKDTFFDTFNQCGGAYRVKYFNHHFSKKLIKKLKDDKKFTQTIKLIVTKPTMKKAQQSLLNISSKDLNFKASFFLAINAIQHYKDKLALSHLNNALKKAYFQMQIDNVTFWQYMLTKDKKYLDKLINSWDLNIYSLYGLNQIKKQHKNLVFNIPQNKMLSLHKFDTTNPFSWLKVLKDTKKIDKEKFSKYANRFNTIDTLGHLAFVSERYTKYKKSYFITPYQYILKNENKNMKALVYAIGRQESRFIPTSISTAYALGSMQIMPFLSKAIAKQLKEKYDIDKQFDPKTNVRYAVHHLHYLKKVLKHPLFIAYGYNGGVGFAKRMLRAGLFKKGRFEPFLSMELLPYDETKKYGKKVLANYFIYQNHLNQTDKISYDNLIKSILR